MVVLHGTGITLVYIGTVLVEHHKAYLEVLITLLITPLNNLTEVTPIISVVTTPIISRPRTMGQMWPRYPQNIKKTKKKNISRSRI